ncbi:hypothetical protein Pelo_14266 [Pelomyxa schiedti]|nr:hypothetical protein Pelo_14266 [Pelomyxa schiedti]
MNGPAGNQSAVWGCLAVRLWLQRFSGEKEKGTIHEGKGSTENLEQLTHKMYCKRKGEIYVSFVHQGVVVDSGVLRHSKFGGQQASGSEEAIKGLYNWLKKAHHPVHHLRGSVKIVTWTETIGGLVFRESRLLALEMKAALDIDTSISSRSVIAVVLTLQLLVTMIPGYIVGDNNGGVIDGDGEGEGVRDEETEIVGDVGGPTKTEGEDVRDGDGDDVLGEEAEGDAERESIVLRRWTTATPGAVNDDEDVVEQDDESAERRKIAGSAATPEIVCDEVTPGSPDDDEDTRPRDWRSSPPTVVVVAGPGAVGLTCSLPM